MYYIHTHRGWFYHCKYMDCPKYTDGQNMALVWRVQLYFELTADLLSVIEHSGSRMFSVVYALSLYCTHTVQPQWHEAIIGHFPERWRNISNIYIANRNNRACIYSTSTRSAGLGLDCLTSHSEVYGHVTWAVTLDQYSYFQPSVINRGPDLNVITVFQPLQDLIKY